MSRYNLERIFRPRRVAAGGRVKRPAASATRWWKTSVKAGPWKPCCPWSHLPGLAVCGNELHLFGFLRRIFNTHAIAFQREAYHWSGDSDRSHSADEMLCHLQALYIL